MQQLMGLSGPIGISGMLSRIGSSVLLAAVCPWIAYQILTARGMESITALAITAVFPVLGTVVGWVRLGRPDIIGVMSILFIGVSIALGLATGSELVILARRSVNNVIFAALCFASLAYGRPLMFHLARQYIAGRNRVTFDAFAERWEQAAFRGAMRRITLGWGLWLLIQAGARVVAAELLDVSTFLIVSPTVTSVGSIAMLAWSIKEVQRSEDGSVWTLEQDGKHLDDSARRALARATEEARRFRQPYVGTEHLLIALTDDESPVAEALRRVGMTLETARTTLEAFVPPGNAPAWQEVSYAPRLRSALRRACDLSQTDGLTEVSAEYLLVGLLGEPDGQAVHILTYMGVDLPGLRARLATPREAAPQLVAD